MQRHAETAGIWSQMHERLLSFIRGRVRTAHDAEDILQETFIKAYQSLKSFQGKAKFSSWLYRIVYNTGISHLRKQDQGRISLDETNIPETLYADSKRNHESLSKTERKKYLKRSERNRIEE